MIKAIGNGFLVAVVLYILLRHSDPLRYRIIWLLAGIFIILDSYYPTAKIQSPIAFWTVQLVSIVFGLYALVTFVRRKIVGKR